MSHKFKVSSLLLDALSVLMTSSWGPRDPAPSIFGIKIEFKCATLCLEKRMGYLNKLTFNLASKMLDAEIISQSGDETY